VKDVRKASEPHQEVAVLPNSIRLGTITFGCLRTALVPCAVSRPQQPRCSVVERVLLSTSSTSCGYGDGTGAARISDFPIIVSPVGRWISSSGLFHINEALDRRC